MKKTFSMLLALTLCLSLAACSAAAKPEPVENTAAPSQSTPGSDAPVSNPETQPTDAAQTPEAVQTPEPEPEPGVRFTKLSSGNCHALALDTDGRIWGWGKNQCSCLGSFDAWTYEPVLLCDAAVFADVQASIDFSAALDADGGLWTWGTNTCGQLGDGSTDERGEPARVLENVASFAVGYDYVAAIAADGTLYTWGNGSRHMLLKQDTNDTANVLTPTPVDTPLKFSYVASGRNSCIAYDTDGIRYAWGLSNGVAGYDAAQIGFSSGDNVVPYVLKPITDDTIGRSEFVIGSGTVYALNEGDLYLAGGKDSRLTAFESNPSFYQFAPVKEGIKAVHVAMYGMLALDADGNVWGWGGSAFPPCPHGELTRLTDGIAFSDVVLLYDIDQKVFAIDENGILYTWLAEGEAPQEVSVG